MVTPFSSRKWCTIVTLSVAGFLFVASMVGLILTLVLLKLDPCTEQYVCGTTCTVKAEITTRHYLLNNCTDIDVGTYSIDVLANKVLSIGDRTKVYSNRDNVNCECPGPNSPIHFQHNVTMSANLILESTEYTTWLMVNGFMMAGTAVLFISTLMYYFCCSRLNT